MFSHGMCQCTTRKELCECDSATSTAIDSVQGASDDRIADVVAVAAAVAVCHECDYLYFFSMISIEKLRIKFTAKRAFFASVVAHRSLSMPLAECHIAECHLAGAQFSPRKSHNPPASVTKICQNAKNIAQQRWTRWWWCSLTPISSVIDGDRSLHIICASMRMLSRILFLSPRCEWMLRCQHEWSLADYVSAHISIAAIASQSTIQPWENVAAHINLLVAVWCMRRAFWNSDHENKK